MKMFDVIRWLEGLRTSLGGPGKWLHNHPALGKREMGFAEMSDKHIENTISMLMKLEDALGLAWNAVLTKLYEMRVHQERRRKNRQRTGNHFQKLVYDDPARVSYWSEYVLSGPGAQAAAASPTLGPTLHVDGAGMGTGFAAYWSDQPWCQYVARTREGVVELAVKNRPDLAEKDRIRANAKPAADSEPPVWKKESRIFRKDADPAPGDDWERPLSGLPRLAVRPQGPNRWHAHFDDSQHECVGADKEQAMRGALVARYGLEGATRIMEEKR